MEGGDKRKFNNVNFDKHDLSNQIGTSTLTEFSYRYLLNSDDAIGF